MKFCRLLFVAGLLVATTAVAQPKPEDQIKYRQSAMMFMRWNLGILKAQVAVAPADYERRRVVAAADVIAAVAESGLAALFTTASATGSGWHETRLKPAYFERPDEAQRLMTAFQQEAKALAGAARTADQMQVGKQFDALFKACKGCHKAFRSKR